MEDAGLELAEVSRRSPLAGWKTLVRAIASMYRREDELAREYLAALPEDAAAARLAPVVRAVLGDGLEKPLSPSAKKLAEQIRPDGGSLRAALDKLDAALVEADEARTLRVAKEAFSLIQKQAPEAVATLRQRVMALGEIAGLDRRRLAGAIGGEVRRDYDYCRLVARGLEQQGAADALEYAASTWDETYRLGVREGLFATNGQEAAEIFVHVAEMLRKIYAPTLIEMQVRAKRAYPEADLYFLDPESLFARAAAIQPDATVFRPWARWAKHQGRTPVTQVLEAWHKACPKDLEPLLELIEIKSKRKAFKDALKYLTVAEQTDGVHPVVRMMRARLLAGSLLNQLKRRSPKPAAQTLEELAKLPAAREGDRPGFLAGLRCLVARLNGDAARAQEAEKEARELLGDGVTAAVLLSMMGSHAKQNAGEIKPAQRLTAEERRAIPLALARSYTLALYFGLELETPEGYAMEAARQLRKTPPMSIEHLQCLAEQAVESDEAELAYAASGAGLELGGGNEAGFLLLRARALPEYCRPRAMVCASAAVELARAKKDGETVDRAVELLHDLRAVDLEMDVAEAGQVAAQEKEARAFPLFNAMGPDYSRFFDTEPCQCPDCRRRRGEPPVVDRFAGERPEHEQTIPATVGLPPGIMATSPEAIAEQMAQAKARGESFEEFLSKALGMPMEKRARGKKKRPK
jgi:hypothetical protein